MQTILHCASAYPDPVAPETQASALLLALTRERFDHRVYSFKRAGWRGEITAIPFADAAGDDHRAMVYGAPPKGLRLERRMRDLADWIVADAEDRGLRPALVHAHKSSLDALVGARVAEHFGVPLVLTVQANTDGLIIGTRRDLRARFREIWHGAALVLPFAPVAEARISDLLGPRRGPVRILPCPTRADAILAPAPRAEGAAPMILTAFHLAHHANKNIRTLLEAVALAAQEVPDIALEIVGGGDAPAFLEISETARKIAPGRVRMLGARPGSELQARMNRATAFALTSRRESYGMVYAEALLAGTPCLHSSGRGIDGLFPDGEMTLGVQPTDRAATAASLVRLCREEAAFKARIGQAQAEGRLEIMRRDAIATAYADGLDAAMGTRTANVA